MSYFRFLEITYIVRWNTIVNFWMTFVAHIELSVASRISRVFRYIFYKRMKYKNKFSMWIWKTNNVIRIPSNMSGIPYFSNRQEQDQHYKISINFSFAWRLLLAFQSTALQIMFHLMFQSQCFVVFNPITWLYFQ